MYKSKNNFAVLAWTVVITSIISFTAAAAIFKSWDYFHPASITFKSGTVKTQTILKYNKVLDILESQYYQNVDQNLMLEGAITGAVDALNDRYTAYYSKEEWQMLEEDVGGSFVGLGVVISTNDKGAIVLKEIMKDSPAQIVGLRVGDEIVKIDDKDITKMKLNDVIFKLIRGKPNTKVKVTAIRPSESRTIDFNVIRETVKVDNMQKKILNGNIGYIRIDKFDAESAVYFKNYLNTLLDNNIKGLIIDVRDDPGGYYTQVVEIADRLLPKKVIVYTEDKYKHKSIQYSDANELKLPLVILVNGNSASASEILAGAVKDNKKGILVGTRTFGKGLVQSSYMFSDGSAMKYTIERYFTPSGVCIQGKGIEPDVTVQLDEKYNSVPVSEISAEDDAQLKAAVKIVANQIK